MAAAPTSRLALPASFRPQADIAADPLQLSVEQLGAVDAIGLGDPSGHLSTKELWGVGEALPTVLGRK